MTRPLLIATMIKHPNTLTHSLVSVRYFPQFNDISKGKDFITKAALYKWDELQELIESGLASKETIDSYVKKLNLKDGKIDIDAFREFVALLDTVLVDGEGNMLEPGEEDRAWKA